MLTSIATMTSSIDKIYRNTNLICFSSDAACLACPMLTYCIKGCVVAYRYCYLVELILLATLPINGIVGERGCYGSGRKT